MHSTSAPNPPDSPGTHRNSSPPRQPRAKAAGTGAQPPHRDHSAPSQPYPRPLPLPPAADGLLPAGAASAEILCRNRILSSKLYLDVPTSKEPVVYLPAYDIAFMGMEKLHPFDSAKWGRICKFLTKEGYLQKSRVVEPLEASKEDLLVVMANNHEAVFRLVQTFECLLHYLF